MAAPIKMWKKYVIQFANQHNDFRAAEFIALTELFDADIKWKETDFSADNPYLMVESKTEENIRNLGSRSVLIRNVIELWGYGCTYHELAESMKNTPRETMVPYFSKDVSFRFELDTFNKKVTQDYKLKRFQDLPTKTLEFQGEVNLHDPDERFLLLEYYGPFGSVPPDNPVQIYFGRLVTEGQRDAIRKYSLQERKFIANTSMDAGLSLLMANIAKVRQDCLVFDPFVGTGSLLVACAHHGAYVMGTDINFLLLHARGKPSRARQEKRELDESIQANLNQYNLGKYYLDAVVGDASKHKMWRQQPLFDVIITDPPYGVREKAKQVRTGEEVKLSEDQWNKPITLIVDVVWLGKWKLLQIKKIGHVPQKIDYHLGQIFKDLLNFAAKFLLIGGRLVYWFPVYRQEYKEQNLPIHPCLQRVANCEQVLNRRISRRLITMEKVQEFQKIHETDNAQMEIDHYEEVSFRQRYFNPQQSKADGSRKYEENGDSEDQSDCVTCKVTATSLPDNG